MKNKNKTNVKQYSYLHSASLKTQLTMESKENQDSVQTQQTSTVAKTIVDRFYDLKDTLLPALVTYDQQHKVSQVYTWKDYVFQARNFGAYLSKTPSKNGNVAIHAFNCPEWFIAAMGSMCAGRYFCGIYNTNKNEQCTHIINTGDCGTLIVESYKLFSECYTKKEVLDDLVQHKIRIVMIDASDAEKYPVPSTHANVLSVVNWCDLGFSLESKEQIELPVPKPSDICTLIFTSGTTGNPKAVEVTHQNVCTAVEGVLDRFTMHMFEERVVTYLPLSHIAGQAIDMYCPLYVGGQVHFARPDAMKGTLKNTLLAAKPTIFFGVPRVWEKFREGLMKVAEKKYVGRTGKALEAVMNVVKAVEYQYNTSDNWYYQTALYPFSAVSSRVVNKIKEQLGLDKCRYFATGAAPIAKEVLEYFASIGIPILELYGMSETCGVITVSDPVHSVRGSCGRAIKGVDVKIGPNDEILARGNNIFSRYHNYQGDSGVDSEGYIHTGDCGRLDDGFLYITGRLKELIITAGGENIPPVLIEDNVKQILQSECQCVLVGDRKKYLTMLIFNPAEETQLDEQTVEKAIREYNSKRAISNAQKVQKFKIVREALTIDNGMITPTMKLKRSKIHEKYTAVVEEMYQGDD